MTMVLGDRRIEGQIKRRAEARQIYEQALAQGQTAALLEQERPNIFTQSVANIDPGQEVRVEISYVDVLRYDLGVYEFQFPMVVGPRYHPGSAVRPGEPLPDNLRGKVSPPTPDTARVPDASRISPPVLKPGFRNGHDIMLSIQLDAGVPLQDLEITNHQASRSSQDAPRLAKITLAPEDTIPNKDFVLALYRRWSATGNGTVDPHGSTLGRRHAIGRRLFHADGSTPGGRAAARRCRRVRSSFWSTSRDPCAATRPPWSFGR